MPKTVRTCDEVVGSRIRLRRKQRAMGEERLGTILGVTSSEIEDFESGATRVGAARLAEIGRVLDAPVDYFFTELRAVDWPRADLPQAQSLLAIPGAAELLSAYGRIASSPIRGVVLRLTRHLARESRGAAASTPEKATAKDGRSKTLAQ